MSSQGRILVIRGGAIGDFILTLPALAAVRQQLPEARLEVLGYPHIAQLALAGGLVDAVHPIEAGPLASVFARGGDLDEKWENFFAQFALIISFLYDPDGIFQANVQRCSLAPFIVGPHRPDETAGQHATRVFLKPLERLAIFEADPVPQLRLRGTGATKDPLAEPFTQALLGASGRTSGEAGLPRKRGPNGRGNRPVRLALHPGSGSERKNWPEKCWAELLGRLTSRSDLEFLIVGGEAEGTRLERLVSLLPSDRVQLARSLPLVELARRLAACAAFVGHDSGITHLAAALGVPTLALWGESVEAIWRPQGDHVTLLRSPHGLNALRVETVLEATDELLRVASAGAA